MNQSSHDGKGNECCEYEVFEGISISGMPAFPRKALAIINTTYIRCSCVFQFFKIHWDTPTQGILWDIPFIVWDIPTAMWDVPFTVWDIPPPVIWDVPFIVWDILRSTWDKPSIL